jgi:Fanconi anemia group M protein
MIAAVVMYNFYRWYPRGQLLFLTPTKPLAAQQMEACRRFTDIPASDMCLITGETAASKRRELYTSKRLFFGTPQSIVSDLSRSSLDPLNVVCLIVDEAHRATGDYAYVTVARGMKLNHSVRMSQYSVHLFDQALVLVVGTLGTLAELSRPGCRCRIVALSATPGNDMGAVQEVVANLRVQRIDAKSDQDPDVQRYVHGKSTEVIKLPLSPAIAHIRSVSSCLLAI